MAKRACIRYAAQRPPAAAFPRQACARSSRGKPISGAGTVRPSRIRRPPHRQNRRKCRSARRRALRTAFRRQLSCVQADEARRGTTLLGPQRDDLCFFINGAEARIYGSQGQQRTVALALKLAEFQLIEDYVGEPPVMLLDDVMSDLDDARRGHLLAWVQRRCQTFLTCTNLRAFPEAILKEAKTFHVVAGTVTEDDTQRPGKQQTAERLRTAPAAEAAPDAGGGTPEPGGRAAKNPPDGADGQNSADRGKEAEPDAVANRRQNRIARAGRGASVLLCGAAALDRQRAGQRGKDTRKSGVRLLGAGCRATGGRGDGGGGGSRRHPVRSHEKQRLVSRADTAQGAADRRSQPHAGREDHHGDCLQGARA